MARSQTGSPHGWDNLVGTARKNIVKLNEAAPKVMLRELFNAMTASVNFLCCGRHLADILRGGKGIPKQCTELHKPEWPFRTAFGRVFRQTVKSSEGFESTVAKS